MERNLKIGDEISIFWERPTLKLVGPYVVSNRMEPMLSLDIEDKVLVGSVEKGKVFRERTSQIKLNDKAQKEDVHHRALEHVDTSGTNRIFWSIHASNEDNNIPVSEQIEGLDRRISSVVPLPEPEFNADPNDRI